MVSVVVLDEKGQLIKELSSNWNTKQDSASLAKVASIYGLLKLADEGIFKERLGITNAAEFAEKYKAELLYTAMNSSNIAPYLFADLAGRVMLKQELVSEKLSDLKPDDPRFVFPDGDYPQSVQHFMGRLNEMLKKEGLKASQFTAPNGHPGGKDTIPEYYQTPSPIVWPYINNSLNEERHHYTTAEDMARVMHAIRRDYPEIFGALFGTKSADNLGKTRTHTARDVIGAFGIIGAKTGYSKGNFGDEAGYNLAAATRDSTMVVLNAASVAERNKSMLELAALRFVQQAQAESGLKAEAMDFAQTPKQLVELIDWMDAASPVYALHPAAKLMQFGILSLESEQGSARGNNLASVKGILHGLEGTYDAALKAAVKRHGKDEALGVFAQSALDLKIISPKLLPVSTPDHADYRNFDLGAVIASYEVVLDEADRFKQNPSLSETIFPLRATSIYIGHNAGGSDAPRILGASGDTRISDLNLGCQIDKNHQQNAKKADLIISNQGVFYTGTVDEAHERIGNYVYERHAIPADMQFDVSKDGNNLLPADQYTAAIGLVMWEKHKAFYQANPAAPYREDSASMGGRTNQLKAHYSALIAEMERYKSMKQEPWRILSESGLFKDERLRETYGIRADSKEAFEAYLAAFGAPYGAPAKPAPFKSAFDNPDHCLKPAIAEDAPALLSAMDRAIQAAITSACAKAPDVKQCETAMQQAYTAETSPIRYAFGVLNGEFYEIQKGETPATLALKYNSKQGSATKQEVLKQIVAANEDVLMKAFRDYVAEQRASGKLKAEDPDPEFRLIAGTRLDIPATLKLATSENAANAPKQQAPSQSQALCPAGEEASAISKRDRIGMRKTGCLTISDLEILIGIDRPDKPATIIAKAGATLRFAELPAGENLPKDESNPAKTTGVSLHIQGGGKDGVFDLSNAEGTHRVVLHEPANNVTIIDAKGDNAGNRFVLSKELLDTLGKGSIAVTMNADDHVQVSFKPDPAARLGVASDANGKMTIRLGSAAEHQTKLLAGFQTGVFPSIEVESGQSPQILALPAGPEKPVELRLQ